MKPVRALLLVALSMVLLVPFVVSDRARASGSAADFAEGSISFLVSKRCEAPRRGGSATIEWDGLTYAAGRPPAWGRRTAGPCRGLDTWVLSESVTAGAFWMQNDHQTIVTDPNSTLFDPEKTRAAFKKAFGWEMPERGDYVPAANVFLKYDAKKLSALFDRLYVKPADKLGLVTGQEVYDVLFKDFVARFAREVALIKASVPKAQLAKLVKAYQAAAKDAGGKFDGPQYLRQAAAASLPKDQEASSRAGRTLGTILRRTADGTWPTVNRLLKKVIGDYDPALSEELGKTL